VKLKPSLPVGLRGQVILLSLFFLALLLVAWLYLALGWKAQLPLLEVPSWGGRGVATLMVDPGSSSYQLGEKVPLTLRVLFSKASPLAGFSLRLKVTSLGAASLTFADADSNQEGIQLRLPESLLEEGWTFPVNRVVWTDDAQAWLVELSGARVGSGPPPKVTELALATFSLTAGKKGDYRMTFDPSPAVTQLFVANQPSVSPECLPAQLFFR